MQLAAIGDAIPVRIRPDFQAGKSSIRRINHAVMIAIDGLQGSKTIRRTIAKHLGDIINRAVVVRHRLFVLMQ